MKRTFRFTLNKLFLALFAIFALCNATYAQDNVITSVMLSKPKELHGAYRLTIKADKPVEYKSKVDSSDSIYFDLKNSVAIDNVDTIYDNVSGIDGVIVQQLENSKVRIYVNGENTASTELSFKTVQPTGSSATNQVVINRPIREYRPTNDMQEIAQEDVNWDENSFNTEHLASSFMGIFGTKTDMTFVICLALLVICVVVSKKMFAKIKFDQEPLIGLNSAYQKNEPEANVAESAALQRVYKAPASPIIQPNRPQAASKFASDVYKRAQSIAPAAPKRNLIKENYALGAYEKSQKNPYAAPASSYGSASGYQKRMPKTNMQNTYASRPLQRRPLQQNTAPARNTGASVDNIKFLESVTKIYEQSGRSDLAQGLRVSINRKKTAVN